MKKLLLITLIALSSCTKDPASSKGGNCWDCTFGVAEGYQKPAGTYCGDEPTEFHMADGTPISFSCQQQP